MFCFNLLCIVVLLVPNNSCKIDTFTHTTIRLIYSNKFKDAIISGCIKNFKELSNVVRIQITNESLPILYEEAISNLPSLEGVDLISSGIQHIQGAAFVNLTNLHSLDLSSNKIEEVHKGAFNKLPLFRLSLSNNRISHVEDESFKNKDLRHLDLSKNKLEVFRPKWFTKSKLRELLLSKNWISEIPKGSFTKMKKLKVLDLSCNRISSLHKNAFEGELNLKVIDLSHNRLKRLPNSLFSHLEDELHHLNLASNFLTYFSRKMMKSLEKLKSLDILRNPLQCSCYWNVIEWIGERGIRLKILGVEETLRHPGAVCITSVTHPDVCVEEIDEEILRENRKKMGWLYSRFRNMCIY